MFETFQKSTFILLTLSLITLAQKNLTPRFTFAGQREKEMKKERTQIEGEKDRKRLKHKEKKETGIKRRKRL